MFADTLTSKFSTINTVVDGGTGDEIDYIDLINKALEKSTGVKKVRRMVKVEEITADNSNIKKQPVQKEQKTQVDYKGMTLEELIDMAKSVGASCKVYENESIYRMRLVMAIKKKVED